MEIEIISNELRLNIHGLSGTPSNKDYVATVFQLSGRMWQIVKRNGIKNKGKNIWVYEEDHKVFAGVELEQMDHGTELEQKTITLKKYAYCKHIGPYNLIKQTGQRMTEWLTSNNFQPIAPYIEIYGHWTNDETKAETELFMNLK